MNGHKSPKVIGGIEMFKKFCCYNNDLCARRSPPCA